MPLSTVSVIPLIKLKKPENQRQSMINQEAIRPDVQIADEARLQNPHRIDNNQFLSNLFQILDLKLFC